MMASPAFSRLSTGRPSARSHADDRLGQLRLAVALYAGYAQDFAGAHRKGHRVDRGRAKVAGDAEVVRLEHGLAGFGLAASKPRQRPANHHLRELRGGDLRFIDRADGFSGAQYGDPVGDIEHLAQLVRDKDDCAPGRGQPPYGREQLDGFLWRQHGGRLVQDEHFGAAVERLDDLHALHKPHRQVAYGRVQRQLDAVVVLQKLHAPAQLLWLPEGAFRGRMAKRNVLSHRQRRGEHEMLVHHADALCDRVARGAQGERLFAPENFAGVGTQHPIEDIHQGRFARAVFTDERVHLAAADTKADMVVGQRVPEPFCNAAQLQFICFAHNCTACPIGFYAALPSASDLLSPQGDHFSMLRSITSSPDWMPASAWSIFSHASSKRACLSAGRLPRISGLISRPTPPSLMDE